MNGYIGIVITEIRRDQIKGFECTLCPNLSLTEDGCIKLNNNVVTSYFEMNLGEKNIYTVEKGISSSKAYQIGQKLMKMGFENVWLSFNNELFKIG